MVERGNNNLRNRLAALENRVSRQAGQTGGAVTIAQNQILGRAAAGSGPATGLAKATILSILNVQDGAQVNRTIASQAQAEAGTDNTTAMTPLAVAQAIAAQTAGGGLQNNFTAVTDPTVTDDVNGGYSVGSVWINNTSDETYRLSDNTAGAAVWVKTSLTSDELATVALSGSYNDLTNQPNHDDLAGISSNEHIDHSGVSITPGVGLEGGGDITTSRELRVKISTVADLGSPAGSSKILVEQGGTIFSAELQNLPGLNTDSVNSASTFSSDNRLLRSDGSGNRQAQDSGIVVDDSNNMSGIGTIATSGNVNGRNMVTDGAKLDGIATGAEVNRTLSTQGEAEGGTDNVTVMTPLRVAQAIAVQVTGNLQANYSATTDPTTTDDASEGYSVGSTWINNTTDEAYRCVDNTNDAAVWVKTSLTSDELSTVAISGDYDDLTNKPDVVEATSTFAADNRIVTSDGAATRNLKQTPVAISATGDLTGVGSVSMEAPLTLVGQNNEIQVDITCVTGQSAKVWRIQNQALNEVASFDSSGNLALDGTVDGRDIAADGSALDSHIADAGKHREINDSGTASTDLWSGNKINTELNLKVPTSRTISTGDGLSGGGDLTDNRTINLDINGATPNASPATTTKVLTQTTGGDIESVALGDLPAPSSQAQKTILVAEKSTAGTITKGQVVYIVGDDSDTPTVELADASAASTLPAIGIADGSITDAASGDIIVFGKIENIDTSGFSAGDILYVSETAGDLTNVKPTGTAIVQPIGVVIKSNATTGIVEIFGNAFQPVLPSLGDGLFWKGNSGSDAQALNFASEVQLIGVGGVLTGTVGNVSYADNSITDAKLANMADSTIKGRSSGSGLGDPENLSATQVRTILNVEDGAEANRTIATQGEAEGGTDNTVAMTPLRVAQAIAAQVTGNLQNNYAASSNPVVTDDSNAGYSVGSVWINNVADEAYRCVDASVGAAVWVKTSLTSDELSTVAISGDYDDLSNKPTTISAAEQTKLGHISVTQAVDLDTMETNISTNNAKVSNATHTGDVTGSTALTIAAGVVTNNKLADMAESTIKGRVSTGTGAPEDLSASQVRTILNVADGANNYVHPDHSGDVASSADGATTIQNNVVTNAKLADMPSNTIKGNNLGGNNDPIDLSPASVRTMLNVADGANNYSHPNHTGDVTSSGDGATTIAADAVTNTKLANMGANTIKGRSGTSGDPQDLSAAQVRTLINVEDGATGDQSDSEIETAYNNQVAAASQAEAEAGTITAIRRFTPQRIAQAIAALESSRTGIARTDWIPANAMEPDNRSANAPAFQKEEFTTSKNSPRYLEFDLTTEQYAYFDIVWPAQWNRSTVKIKPYWKVSGGTGSAVWGFAAVAISDNDPEDASFGTEVTVTDAKNANNDLNVGNASAAITVGGSPQVGDLVTIRVAYKAGSDTLTTKPRLRGVLVQWVEEENDPTAWT